MLLLIGLVSVVLSPGAENDPFAAYHRAIEQQLAGISERVGEASTPGAPEPDALRESAPALSNGPGAEPGTALARLARYRPALESILEQEGVPKSLVAVVLVESGAQPLALSPKQARGLWQIIPATARQYGLTVTASRDDRVDVELATRAAARFLRDLHARFGDWELALAAYNAGPETVLRAIERGGTSTYSRLSTAGLLPEETRNYVPAVLSAMGLLKDRGRPAAQVVYAQTGISN